MKFKLTNLTLTTFQQSILTMFKGTLVSQIIGMLGALYLAKLYGAESYGVYGVFISFSSFFSILNSFQLEQSLVIIKNNNERKKLFNAIFIITFLTSVIVTIIVLIFSLFFRNEMTKISVILFSIIFAVFLTFNKTHEFYLTFKENFKKISQLKVLIIILTISFQLILYKWFKINGLIFGNLFSIVIVSIYYSFINRSVFNLINLRLLKSSIATNKSIVIHLLPSTLISNIAINILPILITIYFGIETYGIYFLSWKIISVPFFLINSSVGQVYYKKAHKLFINRDSKLYLTTKKVVLNNIKIMLIFLILINTIGITILELVLNKSWENLKLYTLILSFLILTKAAFIPISDIMIVLKKNYIHLIFNCYLFIINLMSFYFGYVYNFINTYNFFWKFRLHKFTCVLFKRNKEN